MNVLTPPERRSFLLATLPFSIYMVYARSSAFQTSAGWSSLLGWNAFVLSLFAYLFVRFALRRPRELSRILVIHNCTALPVLLLLTPPDPPQSRITSDTPRPPHHEYTLRPSPLRGPPVPVR